MTSLFSQRLNSQAFRISHSISAGSEALVSAKQQPESSASKIKILMCFLLLVFPTIHDRHNKRMKTKPFKRFVIVVNLEIPLFACNLDHPEIMLLMWVVIFIEVVIGHFPYRCYYLFTVRR